MAVKKKNKRIFLIALIMTLILLTSIFYSNYMISELREDALEIRMQQIVQDHEEMQILLTMANYFGEEYSCIAMRTMLIGMNEDLWDLGIKIDQYRQATEEFVESPFYYQQKTVFNRRAVLYYTLLKRMSDICDTDRTLMLFFYREKEVCPDCDPQAFVLTDIRLDLEEMNRGDDLALFSFDADLNLPTIDLLVQYNNITEFPCVVIGDNRHCGLKNKREMTELLCDETDGFICL